MRRIGLLLVGIGGDDAGVLVAAEGDDSLVLGDRAVIDVRRMGRKKQRGLFHLSRRCFRSPSANLAVSVRSFAGSFLSSLENPI